MSQAEKAKFDPHLIRADFEILQQTIHKNKPLVYLDNTASTQRPRAVIDAMTRCYENSYANVHRGIHWLSEQASAQYEEARNKVARFINAPNPREVIFTSGTTASLNLVSVAWGGANVSTGDEILLTIMEHHSNIVPWQQLASRVGAKVRFAKIDEAGNLDLDDFARQLTSKTKVVSVTAISNVLGTMNPIAKIVEMARKVGAVVVVDAAQHVPHAATDVQAWGADFVAFSGHKMLGPSGIGVLWGRESLLESMPPFLGGGSMINSVTTDGYEVGELPAKFEAGTPPIVQAIGLGAAIDYLDVLDLAEISQHENKLTTRAYQQLSEVEGLKIIGPEPPNRACMLSFTIDGLSSQDIAIMMDRQGVAVRAGHHCAMPLHDFLGLRNSCRASFYLYNTEEEVDVLVEAVKAVVQKLR